MKERVEESYVSKREIEIKDLLVKIWIKKRFIYSISILFGLITFLFSLSIPNTYKSEAVLTLSEGSNQGSVSSGLQYGAIASFAGLNLDNQSNQIEEGIQVLKSHRFIANFILKHNLLVPIMATEGWNEGTDALIIDSDSYDLDSGEWVRCDAFSFKCLILNKKPSPLKLLSIGWFDTSTELKLSTIFLTELTIKLL